MAYAALVSLAQTTDHVLNDHCEHSISPPQKKQIRSLHQNAVFLQAFLEDVPEKANSLEGKIRDLATEAEDIIEYFLWEQTDLKSHDKQLLHTMSDRRKHSHQTFRNNLDKVTKEIDAVAAEVTMNIKNTVTTIKQDKFADSPADNSSSSSSSKVAPTSKDAMIGFENNLMDIKARVCRGSSNLQVIPIVGMGGIGKTTLARNAYDDRLIVEHFQIRAWATVSQDYSTQHILSSLLDSMKKFTPKTSSQSKLEDVYKCLKGRRYLIVMDDVWSTKAWDDFKMIFPDDGNGSRIMLTTRLSTVATYAARSSSAPLYRMHFMDADPSWDLLRHKVFTRDQQCRPELEYLGKMIARSCGGLPLAIVVIAGLLSTVSKTPASWVEIANKLNSAVAIKDGQCENILTLSYTQLPHHLRPCFLYMGCFQEDEEIRVSKLIKLWVAEGFLKPSASRSLEEAAEEYLEDLVRRNLVLVNKRKPTGKIKTCGIHDVLRELCIRKAKEEKFLVHVMDLSGGKVLPESIEGQRRVSITRSDLRCLQGIYGSTIHTIICSWCRGKSKGHISANCGLLRVLDLVDIDVKEFIGREVSKLCHLRYLAFRPDSNYVPESISKLQNLQTLVIKGKHVRLSLEICKMPQLRHLVCSYIFDLSLPTIPKGTTVVLENLLTLSDVRNFICTKRNMKMVPNLKKLGIFYPHEVEDFCHLDNLVHLHQLENLRLEISSYLLPWQKHSHVFPRTLKKLTLVNWRFPWKDMTIIGSLPTLQVLKLKRNFCGDKWETTEGEFTELKFLLIEGSSLQHWITESSHFPRLKYLLLHHCQGISEIPEGIGEIPTLELIEVRGIKNKSLMHSAKRIKEEQQSYGNDALQVRCRRS